MPIQITAISVPAQPEQMPARADWPAPTLSYLACYLETLILMRLFREKKNYIHNSLDTMLASEITD